MIENKDNEVTIKSIENAKQNFLEGNFSFYYRDDDDGDWVSHFNKKNVIVNNARKIMAHMIGDCAGSPYECINIFKLGGSNDLTSDEILTPKIPVPTDTNMAYTQNIFTRYNTDKGIGNTPLFVVSYPNSPNETSVMFTIYVEKGEANLLSPIPTVFISSGLYSNISGVGTLLFASQTFPVMAKIESRSFKFEWEIRF